MPFSDSCSNISLSDDGKILSAHCTRIDGSVQPSTLALDTLLGNDNGQFKWGWQAFSDSAREIRLEGTILHADLCDSDGATWTHSLVNLDDNIENRDGVLQGVPIPTLCVVPEEKEKEVLDQFREYLGSKESSEISVMATDDKEGSKTFYVDEGANHEPLVFKAHEQGMVDEVMGIIDASTHDVHHVDIDHLLKTAPPTLTKFITADSSLNRIHADDVHSLSLTTHEPSGFSRISRAHSALSSRLGLNVDIHLGKLHLHFGHGEPKQLVEPASAFQPVSPAEPKEDPLPVPDILPPPGPCDPFPPVVPCEPYLPADPCLPVDSCPTSDPCLPIDPCTAPDPCKPKEGLETEGGELECLRVALQAQCDVTSERDEKLAECHRQIATLLESLAEKERQAVVWSTSTVERHDMEVELIEVKQSYTECRTKLEESMEAQVTLQYEVFGMRTELDNKRKEVRTQSEVITRITTDMERLQFDLAFSENRQEHVRNALAECKRSNNELTIRVRDLEIENKRSLFVIMERESEIHTLKLSTESLEETVSRQQEDLLQRDESILKLEEIAMSKEVVLTKTKRDVYELTQRVTYLTEMKSSWEARISELQVELYTQANKFTTRLHAKEEELAYANKQLSITRAELEAIRIHMESEKFRFGRFEGHLHRLYEDLGRDVKEAGILRKDLNREVVKAMQFNGVHKRTKTIRSVSSPGTLVDA